MNATATASARSSMTKRERYLQRWNALKTERSSWDSHWRDISRFLLPRSGRFFTQDHNKGDKRYNNIYDSTGTRSLRILAAGLMAGMTSPARPWFRLTTSDTDLMEYGPVKLWIDQVTTLMRDVFNRSNTYRALHMMYEELGAFGTASNIVMPNFNNVIHCYPLTIGEYAISTDDEGNVCTLAREFEMTVSQMVRAFGYDNLSRHAQSLYDNGKSLDTWLPVLHIIEPRVDRDPTLRDSRNMPWASCYLEARSNSGEDKFLRESGFLRFPAQCPRWAVSGGDMYGNSPGMEALGDIKQLQHGQHRKVEAIDYMVKPPVQMPSSLKDAGANLLPGGAVYVDSVGGQNAIKTAFDIRPDINAQISDIQDTRERIRGAFYADLFLMLAQNDTGQMTAREIAERHEEKLLMLGPVLERLHNELLQPLIDITFDRIIETGIAPPIPEELKGVDLNVEFVSMLAQAQRAVGVTAVDRLLGTVASIAQFKPEVLDKIDGDQLVDEYTEMLGVTPRVIVPDDKVAMIRAERAKAQQQAAAMAAAPVAADTAKTLSETSTQGQNGLTDLINQFSGYSIPVGGAA